MMSEGSFLQLACFLKAGTCPFIREALKRSDRGNEKGVANSLQIIVLIASRPEALLV